MRHQLVLKLPFESQDYAQIALQVCSIEKDHKPSISTRFFQTDNSDLIVTFKAANAKILRTVVNSFMDQIEMVYRSLHEL